MHTHTNNPSHPHHTRNAHRSAAAEFGTTDASSITISKQEAAAAAAARAMMACTPCSLLAAGPAPYAQSRCMKAYESKYVDTGAVV
jgi:hypothetical protein